MSRSFDDIVADVVRDEPSAPTPPGDDPPTAPTADPTIMHPVTGEVVNLNDAGADELAALVDAYRTSIDAWTGWRRDAEDELKRRLGKDKLRVFGDWEVAAVSGRGRKWDVYDLRNAVHDLIDADVLGAQDISDLILAGEPSVNGTAAARLLERVPVEHRPALEACFTWERKGRASVRVTRSGLLPAP